MALPERRRPLRPLRSGWAGEDPKPAKTTKAKAPTKTTTKAPAKTATTSKAKTRKGDKS